MDIITYIQIIFKRFSKISIILNISILDRFTREKYIPLLIILVPEIVSTYSQKNKRKNFLIYGKSFSEKGINK